MPTSAYVARVRVQLRASPPGFDMAEMSKGVMNMVYGCIREVNWPFTIHEYVQDPLAVKHVKMAVPVVGMINFLMRRASR